ncbi:MAG TPA: hypothetical protein VF748_11310 [Candidatus Acidoferrum sp.]
MRYTPSCSPHLCGGVVIPPPAPASVGLWAVIPLALQFFTGLYLFVRPYAAKWRSGPRTDGTGG